MKWQSKSVGVLLAAMAAGTAIPGVSTAEDLPYFEQQLEPLRAKPKFIAPGASFDAAHCMKGKTIFSIPQSSANPFTANIEKAMQNVADKVGFSFVTWENQGQSSQWVQGMSTAINQKVDLIDLLGGADPRVLAPQISSASAAGIPVIASHDSGLDQAELMKTFSDGAVAIDYFKAGALLVDQGVVSTKGNMNALVLLSSGPVSTESMANGIRSELKKCDNCNAKFIDIAISDWGSRITPNVQAALLADPSINYILVIYDSMTQFVVPAVTITGSQDRVKIAAFNGTPFVLGMVQKGQVEMDVGENLDWIGHAIVDAHMRRLCGLPETTDPKIPFRVFTKDNAADAGDPPQLSQGYGDEYVQGYHDLWLLK